MPLAPSLPSLGTFLLDADTHLWVDEAIEQRIPETGRHQGERDPKEEEEQQIFEVKDAEAAAAEWV
jgi:hypothetical protein